MDRGRASWRPGRVLASSVAGVRPPVLRSAWGPSWAPGRLLGRSWAAPGGDDGRPALEIGPGRWWCSAPAPAACPVLVSAFRLLGVVSSGDDPPVFFSGGRSAAPGVRVPCPSLVDGPPVRPGEKCRGRRPGAGPPVRGPKMPGPGGGGSSSRKARSQILPDMVYISIRQGASRSPGWRSGAGTGGEKSARTPRGTGTLRASSSS